MLLSKWKVIKTFICSFFISAVVIISGVCCQFDRVSIVQTSNYPPLRNNNFELNNQQTPPNSAEQTFCPEFVITAKVDYGYQLNFSIPDEKRIAHVNHYNGVRPSHYKLDMNFLESGNKNFQSSVVIDLEVVEPTNQLLIDINPNSLIFQDKRKIHIRQTGTNKLICIESAIMIMEDRTMVAKLSDNLMAGSRYTLDMGTFNGIPLKNKDGSWGLQLGGSRDANWALTTIFQMRGARTVFPCFDHPSLKATFSVCIEHSADTLADSNAELAERRQLDNGRLRECYQQTLKMSVYVLSIALMKNFTKINEPTNLYSEEENYNYDVYPRLDLYYPTKTGRQKFEWEFQLARTVIRYMEEKTGLKYPLKKLGLINVNRAPFWGVENFGLVTLEAGFTQANEYERGRTIVVHEVIHQWLGNVVTCSDWSEICLQEGLTALLEWTISHKLNYSKSSTTQSAREARYTALHKSHKSPIIQPFNVTKDIADYCFGKPPVVLNMISYVYGNNIWYDVLAELIKRRPYANANLSDWSMALDVVTGSEQAGEILRSWYTEVGYPVFYAYRDSNLLTIKQYIDLGDNSDSLKKPYLAQRAIVTPVRVYTEKGLAFNVTKGLVIKDSIHSYNISVKQWFIIDPSAVTLSRKVYTVDNYLALIKCFKEKQSSYCRSEHLVDVFNDFCFALTNNWLPWSASIDGPDKFDAPSWLDLFAELYNVSQKLPKRNESEGVKLDAICRLCITKIDDFGKDKDAQFTFYENLNAIWNENCRQLKLLELIGRNYTMPDITPS